MAGEPELKGLAKTFNSVTIQGRYNVARATYGAIALTIIAFKLKNYAAANK